MSDPGHDMRLPTGGLVDRNRPLAFRFDGRVMTGFAGDTIASALMANGVSIIARSFKYHRPRGFFGAGSEEPNAIVTIGEGSLTEPNMVATLVSLQDGMVVTSQNRWPSLGFDIGAVNDFLSPLLPSGFYYKTFMWPAWAWKHYENVIRNAAGFGVAPDRPDPDIYGQRYWHCDVLVVGGGPAGLTAALKESSTGARVLVCDDGSRLGGYLLDENIEIGGKTSDAWIAAATRELSDAPDTTVLNSTTVFGHYDQNYLLAVSRNEGLNPGAPRQTLHKIRAKRVVLATGAIERSLLFKGNDLPGVMLCSAVQRYINRYAVKPGTRAVIYTNNDSGYGVIGSLQDADIDIAAVIDRRPEIGAFAKSMAGQAGVPVRSGEAVVDTSGGRRISSVTVSPISKRKMTSRLDCDLLCVSGGWSPSLHLYSQAGGLLQFDDALGALIAKGDFDGIRLTGAVAGKYGLPQCLGIPAEDICGASPVQTDVATDWAEAARVKKRSKTFVDLQNDVTVADLSLAVREGYDDVELAKRYTTTGMGTDQGRTSNVHAIGLLAEMTGRSCHEVGHTTFRAPYTPVTFGAIAGRSVGERLATVRRTPFHHMHLKAGAIFEPSSSWLYPKYYPLGDEEMMEAIVREVANTRTNVGMVDMSTLGKVEVCGPDAVKFLEMVYINRFAKLPVGRCRYGLMLRHDGMVLDDGTITRISADRYLITMTTAQSWPVQLHLGRLLDIDFPGLDVRLLPVTEQWASLAIAGPKARNVLMNMKPDFDCSNETLGFGRYREGIVAGMPVRIFRISFSGELSYEINIRADRAGQLWDAVIEAGRPFNIMPYGLEALDAMRIEKGHISVGTEIDGNTTPMDLGFEKMIKPDAFFVGSPLLKRPALQITDREQLVGLKAVSPGSAIPGGGIVTEPDKPVAGDHVIGHITSAVYSPTLGEFIALALVKGGRRRETGSRLVISSSVAGVRTDAQVCSPVFFDREGGRLRA